MDNGLCQGWHSPGRNSASRRTATTSPLRPILQRAQASGLGEVPLPGSSLSSRLQVSAMPGPSSEWTRWGDTLSTLEVSRAVQHHPAADVLAGTFIHTTEGPGRRDGASGPEQARRSPSGASEFVVHRRFSQEHGGIRAWVNILRWSSERPRRPDDEWKTETSPSFMRPRGPEGMDIFNGRIDSNVLRMPLPRLGCPLLWRRSPTCRSAQSYSDGCLTSIQRTSFEREGRNTFA